MANEQYHSDVKYPKIRVQLTGQDGNAFAVVGRCCQAMKRHGVAKDEIETFQTECFAGDYNDLLATCMRRVDAR